MIPLGVGLVLGCVLAAANLLVGLKTGMWDTGQLTCALFATGLLALVRRSRDPADAVVAMTAATASGAMPATLGLLGAIPALAAMGFTLSPLALVWLGLLLGAFGSVLGALLAPRLLDVERLPFPSGAGAGELIGSLHADPNALRQRALPFLIAGGGAAALTFARELPGGLPAVLAAPLILAGITLEVGVAVSPLLLGVGALVGAGFCLSLALGGLVAWGGGALWTAHAGLLSTTEPGALGEWLRWPGAVMLVGASLPATFELITSLARGVRSLQGQPRALWLTLAGVGAALTMTVHALFDASWLVSLAAVPVAIVLCTVAVRAAGASDVSPIGDVAQLAQGLGLAASPLASIAAGQVTAGSGPSASSWLLALKTARPFAVPLSQLARAQLGGIVGGTIASVLTWRALQGSNGLTAPGAAQWRAVAELVGGGLTVLPRGAGPASLVALTAGACLAVWRRRQPTRALPDPMALGLGALLPLSASLALVLGALAASRLRSKRGDERVVSVASGLLTGEAVTAVCFAVWAAR